MKALVKPFRWRWRSGAQARRIDAVVGWLVGHLPMTSDWRVQKAFYLAEVQSIEERLERLSEADFAAWDHGPWSRHIRESYDRLIGSGALAVETVKAVMRRPEVEVFKVKQPKAIPDIDEDGAGFLASFLESLKFVSGEEMVERAKATEPYRKAGRRGLIDLDAHLGEMRKRHAALQKSKKARRLVEEALADG